MILYKMISDVQLTLICSTLITLVGMLIGCVIKLRITSGCIKSRPADLEESVQLPPVQKKNKTTEEYSI